MIACTNRLLSFGLIATVLGGVAGCTSIEEAARIDPKSLPPKTQTAAVAPQSVPGVESAVPGQPAVVAAVQKTPATMVDGIPVPSVVPVGGPTIANAQAINPAAPTIENAVAANPSAPTIENAMVAQANNPALQAVQMATSPAAQQVASAVPGVTAADEMPVITNVAIPRQKPNVTLAYAASPAVASFAVLDKQFDITPPGPPPALQPKAATSGPSEINALITKYARIYELPEALVHRVVHRESRYDADAFNRGHYGLMQIKYNTARSMGFDGPANGLFDAESNLKYAIKYLRGAYLVADRNPDGAVRLYARGYYYDAKRKGMLNLVQ